MQYLIMSSPLQEACNLLLRTYQAERAGTLVVWEMNFNRIFAACSLPTELLEHLRTLWIETEFAT